MNGGLSVCVNLVILGRCVKLVIKDVVLSCVRMELYVWIKIFCMNVDVWLVLMDLFVLMI